MARHGIRDKVAIVGMGCTRFGELWDYSTEDLLVEAVTECLASAGASSRDVDAYWLGTMDSGYSGLTLSTALKTEARPVTRVENLCASGSESLRGAVYAVASGAYDCAMAVGVEKLKDSGFSGLTRHDPPDDGTSAETSAPAAFSYLAPAYQAAYDLDEPTMRKVLSHIAAKNHANGARNVRAQFRTAFSEGCRQLLTGRRRLARRAGLLGRGRRRGGRSRRPGRGRAQVYRQAHVRKGPVPGERQRDGHP